MPEVVFLRETGEKVAVPFKPGDTVMAIATGRNFEEVLAECGGNCACATCQVHVVKGWYEHFPDPDDQEAEMLSVAEPPALPQLSRLSCQLQLTAAHDGAVIRLIQNES